MKNYVNLLQKFVNTFGVVFLFAFCVLYPTGVLAQPANDHLANAVNFSAGPLPYTATQSTVNATLQTNESLGCGVSPTRSVWYQFTPTITSNLVIDTFDSTFNTVLSVWTDPDGAHPLSTQVDCNDNYLTGTGSIPQSLVSIVVTSGTTYYIRVAGVSGATGDLTLHAALYPLVSLAISPTPAEMAEAGGTATVTATLSNTTSQAVTVSLGYSGTATRTTDYTTTATTLTIPIGQLSRTVTLTAVDDTIYELDETIVVDIDDVTNGAENGTQQVTATILNDDINAPTVQFTAASQSHAESGTMTVTAQLSNASYLPVTVPFTVTGTATGGGTDYTITASPIIIPAGSLSANITITIVADTIHEPDETVIVTMGEPFNATASGTLEHTATILNNDAVPIVRFTTTSQTGAESGADMLVTASLDHASYLDVTVPFAVTGTATGGGVDYTITASPVTIPAGALTATITINPNDDALYEFNETVIITMGTPAPEQATRHATAYIHTATITSEEVRPTVAFTAADQTGAENIGTMTVTAQLSAAAGVDVTVPFTVAGTATGGGTDYSITTSPITIPAGSLSAAITITVVDDALYELNETVIVTIGTPTNATRVTPYIHTATITDNDALPEVSFTTAAQSGAENAGAMTVTVQLSATPGANVTVPFTRSGTATYTTDYGLAPVSSVTIPAGATPATATITITPVAETRYELHETVILTMGTPTNAILSTTNPTEHTATITNDDPVPTVYFTAASQNGAEGDTLTVTAELSNPSYLTITVPFTRGGDATYSADYTISPTTSLSFAAGVTTRTITITVIDDTVYEAAETVILTMGEPTNATLHPTNPTVHTATIAANDTEPTVQFTAASQSKAEGVTPNTMIVTAQLSNASYQDVTVPFTVDAASTATGGGTDYSITATPITIAAGTLSATITITIVNDTQYEPAETVIVNMGTPTNATASGTLVHTATITDNDAEPTVYFTAASQSWPESIGTMTVTARLSNTSYLPVTVPFTIDPTSTANDPADYTITASPITIAAGSLSADITITVVEETLYEPNETVIINMGPPTNATLHPTNAKVHTATITNNDSRPTVKFTSLSQEGAESIGTMIVTAQLSNPSYQEITVPFTVGGTATGGGTDYTITASPLTIASGDTSANITITVIDDLLDENDETVVITIGTPTNATRHATDYIHTAKILDNDATPTVQFTAASQSGAENAGAMTVTIELSAASALPVTVPFTVDAASTATLTTDYTITASPRTIPAGSTTATITITPVNETRYELGETVIINMGTPTNAGLGAITTHTATITNDDAMPTVRFTAASQTRAETVGTTTVRAQLSNLTYQDVTVPYTLSGTATDPDDYTITPNPVIITVASGLLYADITITIVDDAVYEPNETVILTMGTPTNAGIGTTTVHTLTITNAEDRPTVSFTAADQSGPETAAMTVTAQLSNVSYQNVTVPFTVDALSTALNPDDYTITATPIIITAGSTTADITITPVNDLDYEPDETVIINMGTPVNATAGTIIQHTATITNPEDLPVVQFTTADQTGAEDVGTMTVTAELSGASYQDVTVPFAVTGTATDPADYTITASPITIAAGSTTADITITVVDDALYEIAEAVIVTMGTPTNATAGATTVHTATITDNDAQPTVQFTSAAQSGAENGGAMTVTAQLSTISGANVTVPFTVTGTATGSGTDYTITASPVAIPAGSLTTTITITPVNDTVYEPDETVIVTMGTPTNATQGATTSHTATITNPEDRPTVQFTTALQSGPETAAMTVTAQLSNLATMVVTVPFTVGGSATAVTDYGITASPVTIAAGSLTTTITITPVNDTVYEPDETVIVTMGTPTNATQGATTVHTATITNPEDRPTVQFTSAAQSGAENGGAMTVTAQLSAASFQNVTVPFTVTGTATGGGTDYTITVSPITITAGALTATITITPVNDTLYEANETVIITMGVPTNATAGVTTVHTATITNDDPQPSVTLGLTGSPMAENGGVATVTATLSHLSVQNVTVALGFTGTATGGGVDYTASGTSIVIAAGSNTGTITLTSHLDALIEGNETIIVDITGVTNGTENGTQQVTATITDALAGILVTPTSLTVNEPNGTATFTITLISQPTGGASVTIPLTSSNTSVCTVSSASVTIANADWNTGAVVTVTAVNDTIDNPGNQRLCTAQTGDPTSTDVVYNALGAADVADVAVTVLDDDAVEISIHEKQSGDEIPHQSTYDLGTVGAEAFMLLEFTITNTGTLPLQLTGSPLVALSDPPDGFQVVLMPTMTVQPGEPTEFIILFDCDSTDPHSVTVTIANNDNDEAPYVFNLIANQSTAPNSFLLWTK